MTTWVLLRAAGIGAYLMLFGSVAWGLIATSAPFGKRVAKPTAVLVHQFLASAGLALLAVHLGGLLVDRFMPFAPLDILLPMRTSHRPWAVSVGIVAMYATVFVLVTSWVRKGMRTSWWRRAHMLAVPAFALSLAHGLAAGTDGGRVWMWITYMVTAGIVFFLLWLRAFTVGIRPSRAPLPQAARSRRSNATSAAAANTATSPASVSA